jgi:Protein of unknown function (DUF4058)
MPLLDHFHGALADNRHWESFHGAWAYEMMGWLNRHVLPEGYFAEAQVSLGSRIEVDLPTYEEGRDPPKASTNGGNGGVATQTWAPPVTSLVMPAVFPDDLEVQVFRSGAGANLVGAVELVSPRNKDRPEARRAFAAKSAAYLQRGIGLVVVDVVRERRANLHNELIELLEQGEQFAFPGDTLLYAVAYRPSRREETEQIEIWPFALAVGQPLPTVPLALRGGPTLPLELEATYTETRVRSRI